MSGRLKSIAGSIKDKKQVRPDKEIELEKGDFWALCAAAYSVFGKTLLLVMGFFFLAILIIVTIWH